MCRCLHYCKSSSHIISANQTRPVAVVQSIFFYFSWATKTDLDLYVEDAEGTRCTAGQTHTKKFQTNVLKTTKRTPAWKCTVSKVGPYMCIGLRHLEADRPEGPGRGRSILTNFQAETACIVVIVPNIFIDSEFKFRWDGFAARARMGFGQKRQRYRLVAWTVRKSETSAWHNLISNARCLVNENSEFTQ